MNNNNNAAIKVMSEQSAVSNSESVKNPKFISFTDIIQNKKNQLEELHKKVPSNIIATDRTGSSTNRF